MTENVYDNRIRIVKSHNQGGNAIEFCIPKELCERYQLTRPAHLMLIPEDDSFRVRKLEIPTVGEE